MSNDIPFLVPTYVGVAQKANGKITDQAWSGAQKAEDFQLTGPGGPATQRTEVRVCYDRTALYIRFECFEDQMDSLVVRHTEDHQAIWQDDSVEIYLCPYSVPSQTHCHQFFVNAAGARAYMRPELVRASGDWRAAVAKLRDRWVADITIPFEVLKPLGRNEDCWRVNFCRGERPHGESSSWSPVASRFATYSRFGRLFAPDAPFRFNTFRSFPAPLKPVRSGERGLQPVDGPIKETASGLVVIPEPQELHTRVSKAPFRIGPATRIVVADSADQAGMWTVSEINDAIEGLGGRRLDVARASAVGSDPDMVSDAIVVGESSGSALLRAICDRDRVRMPRSRFGTLSHVVDVLPERVIVIGQSQIDTYYAAQSLKQLMRRGEGGEIVIPAVEIRDYPRFDYRGVHLLASSDALPYISRLIERVLAPLKVNHIVLQTDKVAWRSHPEVVDPENSMPREDVVKLIAVARRHHITVTPLVQSPGHLEWAFANGKNLELAEDPSQPYCYCMSNPRSYEFIFEIMDEAIELFGNPAFFHAGRDEFDMRGIVPYDENCKAAGRVRLYIDDTLRVYEHLRSKGCKMMMWGDVLLRPGFREMAGELPNDIVIDDWHYGANDAYPSVEFFQSFGFPVVGCTWYNPRNISAFSASAEHRSILGMMQTTWTGFEPAEQVLRHHPAQVYAYVLSAAWAWNPIKPSLDELPYRPEVVFRRMWDGPRPFPASDYATVSLARHCNVSRGDSGRTLGWIGVGRGNDLRGIPEGLVRIGGVPYVIAANAIDTPAVILLGAEGLLDAFPRRVDGISVGSKVKALHFLHGCAFAVDDGLPVGSYIVHFEDGATEEIPLVYERNIYAWDDQTLGLAYGFAWRSRGQDGRAVGVCDLTWTNERPQIAVTGIDFIAASGQASPFLLALTAEL